MDSDRTQEERQPKPRNESNTAARSVTEYAYAEDGNYYYKDSMEDGREKIHLLIYEETKIF